jgi:hypothetical protein
MRRPVMTMVTYKKLKMVVILFPGMVRGCDLLARTGESGMGYMLLPLFLNCCC